MTLLNLHHYMDSMLKITKIRQKSARFTKNPSFLAKIAQNLRTKINSQFLIRKFLKTDEFHHRKPLF